MWSWDIVKPVKGVADQARDYSNRPIRRVFGSDAEVDYKSGRIVFGSTLLSTPYFDLKVNAWAEIGDLRETGAILEMNFPFGRKR